MHLYESPTIEHSWVITVLDKYEFTIKVSRTYIFSYIYSESVHNLCPRYILIIYIKFLNIFLVKQKTKNFT